MISHQPAEFGDHRLCGSEDLSAFLLHVILQGHVIKASSNFIGGKSLI